MRSSILHRIFPVAIIPNIFLAIPRHRLGTQILRFVNQLIESTIDSSLPNSRPVRVQPGSSARPSKLLVWQGKCYFDSVHRGGHLGKVEPFGAVRKQGSVPRLGDPIVNLVAEAKVSVNVKEAVTVSVEGMVPAKDFTTDSYELLEIALEFGVSSAQGRAIKVEVVEAVEAVETGDVTGKCVQALVTVNVRTLARGAHIFSPVRDFHDVVLTEGGVVHL